MKPIYLDFNASAPIEPTVVDAMMRFLSSNPGNAASSHSFGRRVSGAVERSREVVRSFVSNSPAQVVFTAGATEANNLAILGYRPPRAGAVLIGSTEHASVVSSAIALSERNGTGLRTLPVSSSGQVRLESLQAELERGDVGLVSVMAANSETGVIADLHSIVELVHRSGALVHTDATQFVGRGKFDMCEVGVDLVSLSAHKLGGPQGVGALVATHQASRQLAPTSYGGGHEGGLRSGTVNAAGVVGFAAACTLAACEHDVRCSQMLATRDRLEDGLLQMVSDIRVIGGAGPRIPNTTNLCIDAVDAEALMMRCDQIAMSSGSACSSGAPEPSPVLTAMGLSRAEAASCIRLSTGPATTFPEIDDAVVRISAAIQDLRALERSA